MSERSAYLDWVEKQAERRVPYCWPHESNGWQGKGLQRPHEPDALDCSGTVTCGLYVVTHGRIDWRGGYSAARLWLELKPTTEPKPGDLAFYGTPGRVTHVMTVVGDGRVVGACGGGRATLSVEIAVKHGACVKYRDRVDYRKEKDFLGYRSLPVD